MWPRSIDYWMEGNYSLFVKKIKVLPAVYYAVGRSLFRYDEVAGFSERGY